MVPRFLRKPTSRHLPKCSWDHRDASSPNLQLSGARTLFWSGLTTVATAAVSSSGVSHRTFFGRPFAPSKSCAFPAAAAHIHDPVAFLDSGFNAGIDQSSKRDRAYGQGMEGYAKRFAANMADQTSLKFLKDFAFPVIFSEDPRFYRMAHSGKGRSIGWDTLSSPTASTARLCSTLRSGSAPSAPPYSATPIIRATSLARRRPQCESNSPWCRIWVSMFCGSSGPKCYENSIFPFADLKIRKMPGRHQQFTRCRKGF